MAIKPKLLDGIAVLEIGQGIGAPLCGRMMADLGAEVVKLEIPPAGDCTRQWMFPAPKGGVSPGWVYYNRGKANIAIDLTRPQGAQAVLDLAGSFDVILENFPPGTLAKFGLDYASFKSRNPRLIMCSLSPHGQTGPLASSPGDDGTAQALTALSQLTGNEDGSPAVIGQRYAEGVGAVYALGAIAAALRHRDHSGQGQYIDLALYEGVLYVHDTSLMQYVFTNGQEIAFPTGAHRPGTMPCGMFRASDGYIVFTILQHPDWEWFIERIGRPDKVGDPRWSNNPDNRFEDRYQIIPIIEQWLQSFPKREEPVRILLDRHLLAGSVLTLDEAANHPQLQSRGWLREIEVPEFGKVRLMPVPYGYSDATVELASRIARFGEDNAAVLRNRLGWSEEKIAALNRSGILADTPANDSNADFISGPSSDSKTGAVQASRANAPKTQILGDVRVLELTNYLAGPSCARIMNDLGAEVVKVEIPPVGDYMRRQYYAREGISAGYAWFNRGKRSVAIDFRRPEGAQIVLDLARHFDVVVQNLTPGTLDKYGLSYQAFNAANPRIIMCSISGYGKDGPYARLPGNDTCSQGMSGLIHLTGNEDGSPVYSGIYLADMSGAINGFASTMAALYAREKTGLGQHIDLALTECLFHMHDVPLIQYLFSQGKFVPQPQGPFGHGFSPCGMFESADGYLTLTVADDHQWRRLADLMGKHAMGTDPAYADAAKRYERRHELKAAIEAWLKGFDSREEPVRLLHQAGIAAMPLYRVDEVASHPHLAARGSFAQLEMPPFGRISLPMLPLRFSDAHIEIKPYCARLGEDNYEVLREFLNYPAEKVDQLKAQGVLYEHPSLAQRGENPSAGTGR
jgi:crotonobetainyl-CoA:carnitine CoA-transferase CaiB-like acyl-CoA transferase